MTAIMLRVPTYSPSQAELRREQRLLNDPLWQSEREFLSDLVARLDAATSDDDFFAVHVSLVARLKARQELIGELRRKRDALAIELRELAETTPKPIDDLRHAQSQLEEAGWAERVQRSLHWLLLDLGDALVWRRLGFDRAAITALGQGQRVAWLSHGRGWDAEMSAVNELWNDGVLAIVNDATTCLRLGDLTCFFDDRVEIREIKAGKLVTDRDPQHIRLRDAITLINERRSTMDGVRRAVVRCSEPLDTYLAHLPKAFAAARRTGHSVFQPSRAQLVVVRDFAHESSAEFDEAGARAVAGWPAADIVLDWGTSLRRMRDRHYNFAYLAPLSLLPLGPEDKVDLLLGQLDFAVWLNVSSIANTLRGRGFLAEPIGPPEAATWFMRVGRQAGLNVTLIHMAAHLREMMMIELMTPIYAVKLIETMIEGVDADPELFNEQTAVVPGYEGGTWGPAAWPPVAPLVPPS